MTTVVKFKFRLSDVETSRKNLFAIEALFTEAVQRVLLTFVYSRLKTHKHYTLPGEVLYSFSEESSMFLIITVTSQVDGYNIIDRITVYWRNKLGLIAVFMKQEY